MISPARSGRRVIVPSSPAAKREVPVRVRAADGAEVGMVGGGGRGAADQGVLLGRARGVKSGGVALIVE